MYLIRHHISWFFPPISIANIYCQPNIPPPKKNERSNLTKKVLQISISIPLRRCAADVLFAHRNAHCNVPDSTLQREGRKGWRWGPASGVRTVSFGNEKTPRSLTASENPWKLMVGRKTIRLPFGMGKNFRGELFVKLQVGTVIVFFFKKSGQFVRDFTKSQLVQYWWYLWSLWRTTNSHRTSTWIHVETRWWFRVFVLHLPTWGNDQVRWIYDLGKSLFIWSQWGSCVWKSSLWRARPRKDGGELPEGNIGSLLVVCWPGSFGCNKKRKHRSVV